MTDSASSQWDAPRGPDRHNDPHWQPHDDDWDDDDAGEWDEEAYADGGLDDFDYDDFVEREFGETSQPASAWMFGGANRARSIQTVIVLLLLAAMLLWTIGGQ